MKDVEFYDRSFLFGFAMDLMEADRFVEKTSVVCGVVSNEIIEDLKEIPLKEGITPKITVRKRNNNRKDLYLLRILRKYLKIYHKNIGFSNRRKKESLLRIIDG